MKCLYCQSHVVRPFSWFSFYKKEDESIICETCQRLFHIIGGTLCQRCGRNGNQELCYDCIRWRQGQDYLTYNRSVYHYDENMKQWFAQFKFRGDVALIQMFQQEWQKRFHLYFKDVTAVIPIPLSEERAYERSFNQSQILAELLEMPIYHALNRSHSEKQSKKSRRERLERDNVFYGTLEIKGERVVLIDDLYTTGVTIQQAAHILKKQGATDVYSYTLARA